MRKCIAVFVMLIAVPLFAEPTPKQRQLIEQLLTLIEADGEKVVRDALVDVYASRFSETELAELVAFYATPTGKKLTQMTPDIQRESAERSRAAIEEQKSPWTATISRMRAIANAVDQFAIDNAEYPQTGLAGLKRMLVPQYLSELPEKDAWGNEFWYITTRYGRHYRIVSAGADGIFEAGSKEIPEDGDQFEDPVMTDDLNFDLIYATVGFMQIPRVAADP